jgi:hypothetical protein
MKKIIISLLIMILLAFTGILIILFQNYPTGKIIEEYRYTHTKAICNETNYCQDYEIVCKDNTIISIKPITGAFVQHALDWKDSRDKETIEKLCE